jgi:NAD-dependent dihydropyrimidine dehydrogenase PreA subunit
MKKESIIICENRYHGNTMKIAEAMAFTLNCEIASPKDAVTLDLSNYKVVGLGSGIFFTSHHPSVMGILDHLHPGQKVFIFSTHGAPYLGKYHNSIKEKLGERGLELIGEFSCKGYDCTGPFIIVKGVNKGRPNENDQRKAMKFIADILPQQVKHHNKVPKGHFVHIDEECIACGACTRICPMSVFEFENNKVVAVHEQDCLHCSLCLNACPNQAISLKHGFLDAIGIAKRHAKKRSLPMCHTE